VKIKEAIDRIDRLKHNTYNRADKIAWLSMLDDTVKRLIIDNHEGWEDVTFNGYDANTNLDTKLLVPSPFDDMYIKWLEAQIDYANGEYDRYNNAMAMYNTLYNNYSNYYRRNNMPRGVNYTFFGNSNQSASQPAKAIIDVTIKEV
jgi:hypothetical protein